MAGQSGTLWTIALALPVAAPALAAEPVLPPSSSWLMDYNVNRCVLSRSFGTAPNDVIVKFVRDAPSDWFDLVLVGRPLLNQSGSPDLALRFGDTGPFTSGWALNGRVGGRPAVFTSGRLDNREPDRDSKNPDAAAAHRSALAAESTVARLHVTIGLRKLVLALGPMAKPMEALRTCQAELVRSWGLDPVQQDALASLPIPLTAPNTWLTSSDYPERKYAAGQQALIAFRLMVDATGVPTDCAVQTNISDDTTFAAATCRAMLRRARFAPARANGGDPVPSYYANKVRWIISGD